MPVFIRSEGKKGTVISVLSKESNSSNQIIISKKNSSIFKNDPSKTFLLKNKNKFDNNSDILKFHLSQHKLVKVKKDDNFNFSMPNNFNVLKDKSTSTENLNSNHKYSQYQTVKTSESESIKNKFVYSISENTMPILTDVN